MGPSRRASVRMVSAFAGSILLLTQLALSAAWSEETKGDVAEPSLPSSGRQEGRQEGRIDYSVEEMSDSERLLAKGLKEYSEGKFDEAESTFKKILDADPANADAYFNLGALAERRGDLERALVGYRSAYALTPDEKDIEEAMRSVEAKFSEQKAVEARRKAEHDFEVAVQRAKHQPRQATVSVPPYPVLTVGQNNGHRPEAGTGRSGAFARAAASVAIGVGVGMLAGSVGGGLHCPMCRIIRMGF